MKVNFEEIYRQIGFLFYGYAMSGAKLSADEVVRLTTLIENSWRQNVTGDPVLNMHLVDCIHEGIRQAIKDSMSAKHAVMRFRDYYQIHPLPFSRALKEKIVQTLSVISNEFPEGGRSRHAANHMETLLLPGQLVPL